MEIINPLIALNKPTIRARMRTISELGAKAPIRPAINNPTTAKTTHKTQKYTRLQTHDRIESKSADRF